MILPASARQTVETVCARLAQRPKLARMFARCFPYLGYASVDDPLYRTTHRFILSRENPHYHAGALARGIGSPHTVAGTIWPMSLILQALTSGEAQEIVAPGG